MNAHRDADNGLPLNIHSPLLSGPALQQGARKLKTCFPDSLSVRTRVLGVT